MGKNLSTRIEELALKLCDLQLKVRSKEDQLKESKKDCESVRNELADIMRDEGFKVGTNLILSNNRELRVKEYFTASIPSESKIAKEKDPHKQMELIELRDECFKWLNENKLGDTIKNNIVANFLKEDTELAKEVMLYLQDKRVNYKNEKKVESQTLKKVLKEHEGNLPYDIFNIKQGMIVDIK